jgi:hypothetical protein
VITLKAYANVMMGSLLTDLNPPVVELGRYLGSRFAECFEPSATRFIVRVRPVMFDTDLKDVPEIEIGLKASF